MLFVNPENINHLKENFVDSFIVFVTETKKRNQKCNLLKTL